MGWRSNRSTSPVSKRRLVLKLSWFSGLFGEDHGPEDGQTCRTSWSGPVLVLKLSWFSSLSGWSGPVFKTLVGLPSLSRTSLLSSARILSFYFISALYPQLVIFKVRIFLLFCMSGFFWANMYTQEGLATLNTM